MFTRFTIYCNTLSHILQKTSLAPCQSYSVGKTCIFLLPPGTLLPSFSFIYVEIYKLGPSLFAYCLLSFLSFCPFSFWWVLLTAATGMEASVGMFTNSLGPRVLYHHMMQLIGTLTVMQMLTGSVCYIYCLHA